MAGFNWRQLLVLAPHVEFVFRVTDRYEVEPVFLEIEGQLEGMRSLVEFVIFQLDIVSLLGLGLSKVPAIVAADIGLGKRIPRLHLPVVLIYPDLQDLHVGGAVFGLAGYAG